MIRTSAVLLIFTGCTVGDASMPATDKTATAAVAPTTGNTVTGSAKFTLHNGAVSLVVSLANAPEGMHGFHVHQNPACGNDGMDAGAHWDGAMAGDPTLHGLPDSPMHHIGDTGNIIIDATGAGSLMASNPMWTLGDGAATDVVNHAVIFHVNMDDGTMASAGARMGCGIIAAD